MEALSGPMDSLVNLGPDTSEITTHMNRFDIRLGTKVTPGPVVELSTTTTTLPALIVPSDLKSSISLPTTLMTDTDIYQVPSITEWMSLSATEPPCVPTHSTSMGDDSASSLTDTRSTTTSTSISTVIVIHPSTSTPSAKTSTMGPLFPETARTTTSVSAARNSRSEFPDALWAYRPYHQVAVLGLWGIGLLTAWL